MTPSPDAKEKSSFLLAASEPSSPLQTCPHCQTSIDITGYEPLTRIPCPGCGSELRVRSSIDQFEIVDVIGSGALGVVYRGNDSQLSRPVAIKVLRADCSANVTAVAQLETETAIAGSINNSHVLKIFTCGIDHGRFYLAMELVEKGSLSHLIHLQGRVAELQALDIGIQIAQGLRAAHQHGLVHRDLRPENILFANAQSAKIADFGFSIFVEQDRIAHGDVWANPGYVAPERIEHQIDDFRADIYSLGATLFHAISGREPFEGGASSPTALKELKIQGANLQSAAPWVMGSTAYVVSRMLAYDPNDRYQSYDELIEQLQIAKSEMTKKIHAAAGISPQPAAPEAEALDEPIPAAKKWALIGAALGVILIVIGIFTFRDSGSKKQNEPPAPTLSQVDLQARFDAAVEKLTSGDAASAAVSFHELASFQPPQPKLNWITVGEGMSELVAERDQAAENVFQRLVDRGLYSTDVDSAPVATFFFDLGRRMSTDGPVETGIARNYQMTNHEAIALLLFGMKNWNLGKVEEANAFFRQFQSTTPLDDDEWIGRLKPLAMRYSDQFASFQEKVARYQNTNNASEKVQILDELKNSPGALGSYAKSLTDSLIADLAKAIDTRSTSPKATQPRSLELTAAPTSGVYRIINRKLGKVMAVSAASKTTMEDMAPVDLFQTNGKSNQLWAVESLGDGSVRLIARHSGKAITLDAPERDDGTRVVQSTIDNSDRQKWNLISQGNGYFKIISGLSGMALSFAKIGSATRVVQGADDDRLEENWQFQPITAPPPATPALTSKQTAPALTTNIGPWTCQDIGNPKLKGFASFDEANGIFTVTGAGKDIWNNRDAFQFVWQQVTGDFDFVVRVLEISGGHPFARGAIMCRRELDSGSANSCLALTTKQGVLMQLRPMDVSETVCTIVAEPVAPTWLKLVRRGNIFTGFFSNDGNTWTQVAVDRLGTPEATYYVGLAVTSHIDEAANVVKFDHVELQAPKSE